MSIQLQNAARVINDATAEEKNVQEGKVFYNNTGRHVGIAEIKTSTPYNVDVTKLDTKKTYEASSTPFYYFNTTTKTIDARSTSHSYDKVTMAYYSVKMPSNFNRLVGITYNSIKYTVASTNTMLIFSNDDSETSRPIFCINVNGTATLNHYIYVGIKGSFIFHYI